MMKCNDCKLTFSGHDAFKGVGGYVCPACHSEEIYQAARCIGCGKYYFAEELTDCRCVLCQQELKYKFLLALKKELTGSFTKRELSWLTDNVYPDLIKALMSKCVEHM